MLSDGFSRSEIVKQSLRDRSLSLVVRYRPIVDDEVNAKTSLCWSLGDSLVCLDLPVYSTALSAMLSSVTPVASVTMYLTLIGPHCKFAITTSLQD
jgi:hypothetical protein